MRPHLPREIPLVGRRLARIETELLLLRVALEGLREAVMLTDRADAARTINLRRTVMSGMDDIRAEVQATHETIASAVLLIDRFADRFETSAGDPDAVMAIVADMRADRQSLAEAVASPGTDDEPEPATDVGDVEPVGFDEGPT